MAGLGDLDGLKALLAEHAGSLLESPGTGVSEGHPSPVWSAAAKGHLECVEAMVGAKMDPNGGVGRHGVILSSVLRHERARGRETERRFWYQVTRYVCFSSAVGEALALPPSTSPRRTIAHKWRHAFCKPR